MPMTKRMAYGITGCLWASVSLLHAADLHFIVLADTNDPAIGTVDDLNHAHDWAQTIADNTGLTLQYQSLWGPTLTVAPTRSLLHDLTAGPDDVIYLFYSGHGGNPDHRYWPIFYYLLTSDGEHVSFDEVVAALQPKNPRMLVVLADTCNNFFDQAARLLPYRGADPSTQRMRDNFRHLFVDFRGIVLTEGASPGEFSLGAQGLGGLFVNAFMNSINTLAVSEPLLTWETVLAKAAEDTATAAGNVTDEHGNPAPNDEHPIYLIQGGLVADAQPETMNLDTSQDPTDVNVQSTTAQAPASPAPLCGSTGTGAMIATLTCLGLQANMRRRPKAPGRLARGTRRRRD